ncbi:MAG: hypothetical protein IH973_10940 [Myxococcales bacterium]|nr:hypothetical protein [Myxococcales bacterium]
MNVERGRAPSVVEVRVPGTGQGDAKRDHSLVQLISLQQVFDIYIPDAIFGFEAVKRFLGKLSALSEGATLYQGVEGDWYHETEPVRVLRMSITTVTPDGTVLWTEESIREAIANLICDLTAELRDNHGHFEDAIFFNDWRAKGTVIKGNE